MVCSNRSNTWACAGCFAFMICRPLPTSSHKESGTRGCPIIRNDKRFTLAACALHAHDKINGILSRYHTPCASAAVLNGFFSDCRNVRQPVTGRHRSHIYTAWRSIFPHRPDRWMPRKTLLQLYHWRDYTTHRV